MCDPFGCVDCDLVVCVLCRGLVTAVPRPRAGSALLVAGVLGPSGSRRLAALGAGSIYGMETERRGRATAATATATSLHQYPPASAASSAPMVAQPRASLTVRCCACTVTTVMVLSTSTLIGDKCHTPHLVVDLCGLRNY